MRRWCKTTSNGQQVNGGAQGVPVTCGGRDTAGSCLGSSAWLWVGQGGVGVAVLLSGGLGWALSPPLTAVRAPGLAVDYHNERLYWADAKLSVIGSIRLNGTDPVVAIDNKKGEQSAVGGQQGGGRPVQG